MEVVSGAEQETWRLARLGFHDEETSQKPVVCFLDDDRGMVGVVEDGSGLDLIHREIPTVPGCLLIGGRYEKGLGICLGIPDDISESASLCCEIDLDGTNGDGAKDEEEAEGEELHEEEFINPRRPSA